ncbi:MAG TPA: ATP-binding protein, partial [Parafilimonas sp.]|nr:ATP-binding protein [Parafilimonas sp.]
MKKSPIIKICVLNFFVTCGVLAYAQSDPVVIDSLKRVLTTQKEDTNRVRSLDYLSAAYAWTKPDSAIIFGQQGLALATRIHDVRGEALIKHHMGLAFWLLGDYLQADKITFEALKYEESVRDTDEMINSYAIICSNKRDNGDYRTALEYSFKAYSLCKGCDLFKIIIGGIYMEMNMSDSAFYYLKQAQPSSYAFWLLGRTYEETGNNEMAYQYYLRSISDALTNGTTLKNLSSVYSSLAQLFKRQNKIDSCVYYAKKAYNTANEGRYRKGMLEAALLLSTTYENSDPRQALNYYKLAAAAKDSLINLQKTTQFLNSQFNEQLQQQQAEAKRISDQTRTTVYLLLIAVGFFVAIAIVLYRSNVHKQQAKTKIEKAYDELKLTQAQLIQSEKMASLGELTAGIAHEIQNPLNFVNNFTELNSELIEEMNNGSDINEVRAIANDVKRNNEKIAFHGKRADAIVKGMLQHTRVSTGQKEPTNINALADEYLRLAYHGMRAKDKSFNATLKTDFDDTIDNINIVSQDIGRVLLNLYNNAFYAVSKASDFAKTTSDKSVTSDSTSRKLATHSSKLEANNAPYAPTVTVVTKKLNHKIEIRVRDNGPGIPQNIVDKIFQPFFTTKPTGEGTGLGLSLSYDIIKAHGG